MRKKLMHNWLLKLASLLLAVILWFLVVQFADPKDTKTFNNISVRLTNTELLRQENKVYEVIDDTDVVSVTVRAPKSIIGQLRASDIIAEADVSKITDINTIAISYSVQNVEGVESVEGNHEVVRLNVEDRSTRWVRLSYKTVGEVAENYMVMNAVPDQTLIEVSGPKSVVDSVSYAGVEIDVTGYTTNLSANLDIGLFDKEGNEIKQHNITTNVDHVHMSVEILATKEVPIEVNYMGVPAQGYMATGVAVSEPATVRIAGTSYALSNVNKISISEDRLNITGESSNMTDIINLVDYLPENVRLADAEFNGKITATVYVEPIINKELEIPAENVSIVNLPQGVNVTYSEESLNYTLKVSGLGEFINPLQQMQIRGTADVAKWMKDQGMTELGPGTYSIPVDFELSEEIEASDVYIRILVEEIV